MTKVAGLMLVAVVLGCSPEANQKGQSGADKKADTTATATTSATATATATASEAGNDADPAVFTTWCQKSGETAPAQGPLKRYHALFCEGGPTELLTSTLVAAAY